MSKEPFFSVEKVPPMFLGGHRDWSVDVLRCLSCFMVCGLHAFIFAYRYGIYSDVGPADWTYIFVYRMIFSSPTVLFVMVSGIFFLSPERNVTAAKVWKKNVLKMTGAYIFWSLIYALYRIHLMDPQPDITPQYFVHQWLIEPYHMWYIPMIIGLYIICPIIRPITATGDTKLFRYIIMIFVGALIVSTIYNWPGLPYSEAYLDTAIEKTPMALICQYPFWMIFGWIAYTYRPTKRFRYLIYALGVAALIAGIWFNDAEIQYSDVPEEHCAVLLHRYGLPQSRIFGTRQEVSAQALGFDTDHLSDPYAVHLLHVRQQLPVRKRDVVTMDRRLDLCVHSILRRRDRRRDLSHFLESDQEEAEEA